MADYRDQRETTRKTSVASGIIATAAVHIALALLFTFSGLRYIYPPPEEKGIEIQFEEEEQVPIRVVAGKAPESPKPDPDKDIKLAKASEAPFEGTKANEAEAAVNDEFGDVETPAPKPKKEVDKRALFPSADNKARKDTLAAQTAARVSDALSAGHSLGNTRDNDNEEESNAKLKGRDLQGALPQPAYPRQVSGKVIIKIWVDQYGKVQRVEPTEGSTITNSAIWEAACEAAKKAVFTPSSSAGILQEGTITYIFKLK